jgi:hypothetical protein
VTAQPGGGPTGRSGLTPKGDLYQTSITKSCIEFSGQIVPSERGDVHSACAAAQW